jgi:cysteine synthase
VISLAEEMRLRGARGAILSLLCDAGERYLPTYHDAAWVETNFGDCSAVCGAFGERLR